MIRSNFIIVFDLVQYVIYSNFIVFLLLSVVIDTVVYDDAL